WAVGDVDWHRRVVWVEPSDDPGRSRWAGSGGALSIEVGHAIRRMMSATDRPAATTRRAVAQLDLLREDFPFAAEARTTLERDQQRQRTRWWTFAGGRANAELARRCATAGIAVGGTDDLSINLLGMPPVEAVQAAVAGPGVEWQVPPTRRDAVKFSEAVPEESLDVMVRARDADADGVARVLAEAVTVA
ncbi:MAG: hypothetical protein ACR2MB_15840, partial [Acidimicrobiales bacterium]